MAHITVSKTVTSNGFPLITIMQFEWKLCLWVSVVYFVPLCAVWWGHGSWFLLQPLPEHLRAYLHLHHLLWVFRGYHPCCWDQPSLAYSPSKMRPCVCVCVSLVSKLALNNIGQRLFMDMHEREILAYTIIGVGIILTFGGAEQLAWCSFLSLLCKIKNFGSYSPLSLPCFHAYDHVHVNHYAFMYHPRVSFRKFHKGATASSCPLSMKPCNHSKHYSISAGGGGEQGRANGPNPNETLHPKCEIKPELMV